MLGRSLGFLGVVGSLAFVPVDAADARDRSESGIASIYMYKKPRPTASGERTNNEGLNAAHKSLPFGTMVRVTNRRNNQSVVVRIIDRGPYIRGRIIDVTPAAARALGFWGAGVTPVTLAVVGKV